MRKDAQPQSDIAKPIKHKKFGRVHTAPIILARDVSTIPNTEPVDISDLVAEIQAFQSNGNGIIPGVQRKL